MMLIEYDWLMYGEERSFTEGLSKQENAIACDCFRYKDSIWTEL